MNVSVGLISARSERSRRPNCEAHHHQDWQARVSQPLRCDTTIAIQKIKCVAIRNDDSIWCIRKPFQVRVYDSTCEVIKLKFITFYYVSNCTAPRLMADAHSIPKSSTNRIVQVSNAKVTEVKFTRRSMSCAEQDEHVQQHCLFIGASGPSRPMLKQSFRT